MNVDTWAVVLATFFGPITALLMTRWRDGIAAKYNRRMFVFRALMATRKLGISPDHVNALNLIEVDFYKCEEVEKAWKTYLDHLNTRFPQDDEPAAQVWGKTKERRLAQLLFQISKVLKFDMSELDLFEGGYAPEGWAHRDSLSNDVLEYFRAMSRGKKEFPLWINGITPQAQQAKLNVEPNVPAPQQ
ncbi:DUF6680 family protein [Paraburkholderia adhaesiva]|uniref:DUF6680 family protein n=1 Tax=Paraburkholderia adhaesiva TaxID=2883244 RepID=UPI001F175813|nr:DUF6680 family protein [Paraburkholderia adhaesiva]